jgi:hypothetical protein
MDMISVAGFNGISRRELLACGAAMGVASAFNGLSASAATASRTIDFHHHFNPPFLVNASAGNRVGAGEAGGLNWDLAYSLEDMDKAGIAKSVLSPPTGFAERLWRRSGARPSCTFCSARLYAAA